MKITRAVVAASLLCLPGIAPAARAQAPAFKIMAPAAPGGGWDQTARSVGQALQAAGLASSVQVTNVTGAGGTIGIAQFVKNARGDPSQLMASGYVMVGAILTNKAPVTLDEVTPIARLTGEWQAIAVPAGSSIRSMKDLAEALKADPGRVTWGGGSAGGPDHILAGLVAKAVGADPTRINYIAHSGGGEAMAAILSGKITAGVNSLGELLSQVETGKLRLIGIASPQRLPGVDGPTLKESGIDIELANWRMIVAPPGISNEDRARLVAMFERLHKSEPWKEVLRSRGWDDIFLTGPALEAFLKAEQARTAAILREVGLLK
jgi:putative tricarboxylic transport membrane protein